MATLYDYVEETGVIVPKTEDLIDSTRTMMKAIFGDDIQLDDETPAGRLVEAFALLKSRVMAITAQNGNQLNENYATGIYLDAIAEFFGLERKGATATTVMCELTGKTDQEIVRAGWQAEAEDGNIYELVKDAYFVYDSETGTYRCKNAPFKCTKTGPIECPVNTVTKAKGDTSVIESITNNTRGVMGWDVESDLSFRRRIRSAKWNGATFTESIISQITKISTVNECKAWENFTSDTCVLTDTDGVESEFLDTEKYKVGDCVYTYAASSGYTHYRCKEAIDVPNPGGAFPSSKFSPLREFSTSVDFAEGDYVLYDGNYYVCIAAHPHGDWDIDKFSRVGIPIRPHSVLIVVDGEDSDDENKEIGTAIYKTKPAGTDMSAIAGFGVGIDHIDELTKAKYRMLWSKTDKVKIMVRATIRNWKSVGSEEDVEKKVRDAVTRWLQGEVEYVDGVSLGQQVYAFEIGAAISDTIPTIQIVSVEVAVKATTPQYGMQVAITNWQKADIEDSEDDIAVELI